MISQNQLNRLELSDSDNMLLSFPKRLLKDWLRFNTNSHLNVETDEETKDSFLIMKNNTNPYPGIINPFNIAWILHEKGILNHFTAIKTQMHILNPKTQMFKNKMNFDSKIYGSERYLHINNQTEPKLLKWDEIEWSKIN